jgi:hypothetical protein
MLFVLLAVVLACAVSLRLTLPAHADEDWSISDDNSKTTTTTDNSKTTTDTEKTTTTTTATDTAKTTESTNTTTDLSGDSGTKTEEPAVAARVIPAKTDMHAMLADGKTMDAEAAYLEWAAYWRDDDPVLIQRIERAVLIEKYKAGKYAALTALVEAGDTEARRILRAAVLAGGSGMPSDEFVAGIRFIGRIHDQSALNMLRLALYSEDKAVVVAAIDALGDIGDKRVVNELLGLFDDADVTRCVALARALNKLGAAKQVRARFEPQLRFPLAGAKEKAALALAALGNPAGWGIITDMVTKKDPAYYPLVLTVLTAIPSEESASFIMQGLAGKEDEQLAALKSINVIPDYKVGRLLLGIARDVERPEKVRVEAIRLITAKNFLPSYKYLRAIASNLEGETEDAGASAPKNAENPAVKGAAIKALVKFGMLDTYCDRERLRQRFDSKQEDVALAARAALYLYAVAQLAPKK